MLRRSFHALSVGIWVGALAGVATASADYGAHWLFMESARDRLGLLLCLLSIQPALGAAVLGLGLCAATWQNDLIAHSAARTAAQNTTTRLLLRTAPWAAFALLLSWPLTRVAQLLWSGGKMRQIPHASAWSVLSAGVLILAGALLLRAVLWLLAWARRAQPSAATQLTIALFAAGFALSKLDQWILPSLYDYLHALLGCAAFLSFALAIALPGLRAWDAGRLPRALLPAGLGVGAALAIGACFSLRSLDANQNVRVALVHTNMPHSRALLTGIAPFLPRVDSASANLARTRAALSRKRREQPAVQHSDLPTLDDAHLLLITIDALRADHLGLHGYPRGTSPALDALGARGVVFEHAYAQAPHSSYSLCSLMTSEYLHETLELGQAPPKSTLPLVLAGAGYHTAAFYTDGIFHTAGERLASYERSAFGFALHEHQDRPAEEMTDRVLAEIDRTLTRGEPSAFFWAHYFDVHEPYEATTFGTSDLDRYDSELLAADRAIGRLVREAERRLHKPLVIVITADHGEEFHEHGGVYHGSSLYEEQVHVPLLIVAPGVGARRVSKAVESVDIAPSALALLGIAAPTSMRGNDLRPLMLGREVERAPAFSAVIHKKMAVSWPYKLVADLRFGSFELYDLAHDPGERDNLADRQPERVSSLRGEVYAWLDSLARRPSAAGNAEPTALALEWGRLGDRRAVAPLCELLIDEAAQTEARSEAARLLGKLADDSAGPSLLRATRSHNAWVAAEAAIALGRMFDDRAIVPLRALVRSEDPGIRSRAAVSLGRLRDPAAVPSLVDALWLAPNPYEREEAVRWLGRLHDARALDPLLNLLPEPHTRHLVVIALGELGDSRAFAPLAHVLQWDRNTNVRDGVVRSLGILGDARALDVLLPLLDDDPALRNTAESLVRLHALERKLIGGTDLDSRRGNPAGFARCYTGPQRHDWDYLHRTTCTTEHSSAELQLRVPAAIARASHGAVVVLGVRRSDATTPTELQVLIDQRALPAVRVDGAWNEYRWPLPPGTLSVGHVRAELRLGDSAARIELDHVLLVPRTSHDAPIAHGG